MTDLPVHGGNALNPIHRRIGCIPRRQALRDVLGFRNVGAAVVDPIHSNPDYRNSHKLDLDFGNLRPPCIGTYHVCIDIPICNRNPSKPLELQGALTSETSHVPLSKLLVSPFIGPLTLPYIMPHITPFKEFRP